MPIDDLIQANERFAQSFMQGGLGAPPARRLAILTCMDARIHPESALGLEIGDAHVIRNAGGRASDDAIRSLIISSRLLGTNEYLVIHHTDCGMTSFTNEDLRARLRAETGTDPGDLDFLPFSDDEQSVRDDVQRIRENPFIPPEVHIHGFLYNVHTGRLQQVE